MAKPERLRHVHDWIPYVSDEGTWSDRCFTCGVERSRASGSHAQRLRHVHDWIPYVSDEGAWSDRCLTCGAERFRVAARQAQGLAHVHRWVKYASEEGGCFEGCAECGAQRLVLGDSPPDVDRPVAAPTPTPGLSRERQPQARADERVSSSGVTSVLRFLPKVVRGSLELTPRPPVLVAWIAAVAALVTGVLIGAGLGLLIWVVDLPQIP